MFVSSLMEQFILKKYVIELDQILILEDYLNAIKMTYNKNDHIHILNKITDTLRLLSVGGKSYTHFNEYSLMYNNDTIIVIQLNSVEYSYLLRLTK